MKFFISYFAVITLGFFAFLPLSVQGKPVGGETSITSNRMEYDYSRSSIIFDENVRIKNPDYEMTCARLVVMLDSTNDVKWIKATKNVLLVNGDRSAKCEEALYTKADGKVVMTGTAMHKVVLKRLNDQMEGDKITIWLNEERVECLPARMVLQDTSVNSKKGGAGNILPK